MGFLDDQEFWALSQCSSGTDFAISASQNERMQIQTDLKYDRSIFKAFMASLMHSSGILATVVYLKQDLYLEVKLLKLAG